MLTTRLTSYLGMTWLISAYKQSTVNKPTTPHIWNISGSLLGYIQIRDMSRSYLGDIQIIYGAYPDHTLSGTCIDHIWDISGVHPDHTLCRTCLDHIWDISGSYLGYIQIISRSYLGHIRIISGVYPDHTLSRTCVDHVWDISGSYLGIPRSYVGYIKTGSIRSRTSLGHRVTI